MLVYVVTKDKRPLMPCTPVIARLLLKQEKAKVKRREPFTIQLLYETAEYKQDLELGVDTGSGKLATAVRAEHDEIVYLSEVAVRNDITGKMTERKSKRRNRRNRKTRYRKPRFDNRGNSKRKDRFSPTMQSKIHSHVKEIEYIKSILPITRIILEMGQFDPHRMKNPALANPKIRHWGYQKGPNYGYENTRAMVLDRDNHQCQYCHGKRKDRHLEVHHIIFRSQGGSDDAKNLITLCHPCHQALHKGKIRLDLEGMEKGTLKYATQMNSIRKQLLRRYPEAIETYGYITKANRWAVDLPKEHYIDACVIATEGRAFTINNILYRKKCVSAGDFQQYKGKHSEIRQTTGKIMGFRKYDKVRYFGKYYFIKGRMFTGYAALMDINGDTVKFSEMPWGFKTPKLERMERIQARSTWMIMSEEVTPNIA